MATATLYQTVLLELYERFEKNGVPNWVADGLIEEGLACRDEEGRLVVDLERPQYGVRWSTRQKPAARPNLVLV